MNNRKKVLPLATQHHNVTSLAGSRCSTTPYLLVMCAILACFSIYQQGKMSGMVYPLQFWCQNNNNNNDNNSNNEASSSTSHTQDAPILPDAPLATDQPEEDPFESTTPKTKPPPPRLHVVDPLFQAEYDRIDNEDPAIKCARYGLKYIPGTKPRRLFFGTMMADESWDVFVMHAVETHGVYHSMSLVESNTTHMGYERTLNYGPESQRYQDLVHGQMFGPDTSVYVDYFLEDAPGAKWMIRESVQRDLIRERWIQEGMTKNDVGVMSDVDEIWSRDFLRAAQVCQIGQFNISETSCKTPKVVATSIQFEASPECIKHKTWFHPDMISGHCIEGIGDSSERMNPLRLYERTRGERTKDWGSRSMDQYPKHVLESGRYPLYSASDIRTVHGDNGYPINFADLTGDGKTHALGTAFHFHNWFTDFSQLRHKYRTYSHADFDIYKKSLSKASEDMDIMVRCVHGLPNSANPRNDMRRYYTDGYDAIKGPKPIYFKNTTYRHERHELLKREIFKDEAKYGSWYAPNGTFLGELDYKTAEKEKEEEKKRIKIYGKKFLSKEFQTKRDIMVSDEARAFVNHNVEIRKKFQNKAFWNEWNTEDMSENATVMGMATHLGFDEYRHFVGSLRQSGYRGKIILGISDSEPKDVMRYLKLRDVTTKIIHLANCTYKPLTGTDVEKYKLNTCGLAYPDVKLRWMKFPIGRDWLEECKTCTGPVLLVDVRDTFFQRNPFGKGQPTVSGLQVFEEHPDSSASHWLVSWPIGDCKGQDKVPNSEIMLCSGTVIGTRSAMMDYLNAMYKEMKMWISNDKCRFNTMADDQSIHNWLYYSHQFKNARAIPNRIGLVHTVGYEVDRIRKFHVKDYMNYMNITEDEATPLPYRGSNDKTWLGVEEFQLTNEEGLLVNYNGNVSPIVHQFDRMGVPFTPWLQKQKFLMDDIMHT